MDLLHHDHAGKKVTHYVNEVHFQCCLVGLYKLYISKYPPLNTFNLKSLKWPKGSILYQKVPIGHNTVAKMVSRMMKSAGIPSQYTNHSLRSTATSRLFNAKVDEQLTMAHLNTTGVQSLNDQLLNAGTKKY